MMTPKALQARGLKTLKQARAKTLIATAFLSPLATNRQPNYLKAS